VTKYVHTLVRQILKLEDTDVIGELSTFQDLGMDSLMMIEMNNMTQNMLGQRANISLTAVKDCTTVSQLSGRIYDIISRGGTKP